MIRVPRHAGRWVRDRSIRGRSRLDFELYRAEERKGYYLGLVGLLLGLTTFQWEEAGPALATAGALLSLATVRADRRARRAAQDRLAVRRGPPVTADGVRWPAATHVLKTAAGTALHWEHVDDALRSGRSPAVKWDGHRYRLPPALAEVAYDGLLREFRGHAQPRFNGPVVRQGFDLEELSFDEEQREVLLSRASYFDMLCSTYSTGLDVYHGQDVMLVEGRALVLDRENRLRRLSENRLANGIGVSTVAVTSDGALVLVRQSSSAVSSPGRLAPSGSGSLESVDVRVARQASSGRLRLADVLVAGMQRELAEELNLQDAEISMTAISGHFRWFENGTKPEYTGVSLLGIRAVELLERPRRASERPFVAEVLVHDDLPLDLLRQPNGHESLLATVEARFRCVPSLPLIMAARALGRCLADSVPWSAEVARRVQHARPV